MLWIMGGLAVICAVITFVWILEDFFFPEDIPNWKAPSMRPSWKRTLIYRNWKRTLMQLIAIVVAIGVSIGCYYALNGIYNMRYEESNQSGKWTLVPFSDNNQHVYGALYYLRVSIESKNCHFYSQLENKGYKQRKITAESAVIFEQDDVIPHVIQYTVDVKNKMPKWLHNILAFGFGNKRYNTFEFFVPKGTVDLV